ncbi:MAG: hypothetical protein H7A47_11070 [Verrucomicrobiales bacterium]|nr:hypothetical protein [Verrucomicrobiales bacterium]
MSGRIVTSSVLLSMFSGHLALAGVVVDTSIGTAPPPTTLGGYPMGGFPPDLNPTGTAVLDVPPPSVAPVTGNLVFSAPATLYVVGTNPGEWDGWSHGYAGDVYHANWTGVGASMFARIDLALPANTLAFALYLEPEVKTATWDFDLTCTSVGSRAGTVTGLSISGGGGARYVGFYTDDPTDPLASIQIATTTEPFLGFGMGEFTINVIPEPGASAVLTGGLLLGAALAGRRRILAQSLKRLRQRH